MGDVIQFQCAYKEAKHCPTSPGIERLQLLLLYTLVTFLSVLKKQPPTTWTQEIQREGLLVLAVFHAPSTMHTTSNAEGACATHFICRSLRVTALVRAVVNKPHILAPRAYLDIKLADVVMGDRSTTNMVVLRFEDFTCSPSIGNQEW